MTDIVIGRIRHKFDKGQPVSPEKDIKRSGTSVYTNTEKITIEVKKSEVVSDYKGSDENIEYKCDTCKNAGDYVEAEGYCTDCKEYLCSMCFQTHSKNKFSIHHIWFGRDDMPKQCNPCKQAGDEIQAIGYCDDCCSFVCDNCFKNHPRNKLTENHSLIRMVDARGYDAITSVALMNIKEGTSAGVMASEDYTYIRDVNAKSEKDEGKCYITNITIVSNKELVLCDNFNKCLKLVDINENITKDVLLLECVPPLGITKISNDQIAVVLYNRYFIQIVTVRDKLTLNRKIKTSGYCVNVKMMNKHLYVSFQKPLRFQILHPTGAIIKTIKPGDEVLSHCIFPAYFDVSPDEKLIYVSDWLSGKVLSLDMKGDMIALYQEELDDLAGIIISPSGSVYVCNGDQHIVYKMTSDLSESIVVLGPGDGLHSPHALCLDAENQSLYISSGSYDAKFCDSLKVFRCFTCIETLL